MNHALLWLLRRGVIAPAVIVLTTLMWVTLPAWLILAALVSPALPGRWRALRLLWIVMLSFPLPFIANTAGWMTAELGRQPWLVYGLLRTEHGHSPMVSSGNVLFTLLGFLGVYTILSLLYIFLMLRRIEHGAVELGSHEVLTSGGETAAAN